MRVCAVIVMAVAVAVMVIVTAPMAVAVMLVVVRVFIASMAVTVPWCLVQHAHESDVDNEANCGHDEHEAPIHLFGLLQRNSKQLATTNTTPRDHSGPG
jgi:hypothetical protein